MVFVKQERLLRTSKCTTLQVHIYVQECNVAWFTDVVLQEILHAIQPALQAKAAECLEGVKKASQFKNRALQVAYYIDKADFPGQVLLQEPRIKDEDEISGHNAADDSPSEGMGVFTYNALRPAKSVLILVPEPFDANNDVTTPDLLNVDIC
ncbi:hypothetical protein GGI20_000180 [Coemansia sp. BCRC 34301]|nr:hypothetical protein GGI20_000180 [Coemansia sp. BCRC 34301]